MVSLIAFLTATLTLLSTVATAPSFPSSLLHPRQDDTLCGTASHVGIVKPTEDTVFTFDATADEATIEVIFCSGQYFKTRSIDASVWLSSRGSFSPSAADAAYGQLMVKNQEPDNSDVPAGYYSYRLPVTLYPGSQGFQEGPLRLCVYEQASGYYYEYGYELWCVNITINTNSSSVRRF